MLSSITHSREGSSLNAWLPTNLTLSLWQLQQLLHCNSCDTIPGNFKWLPFNDCLLFHQSSWIFFFSEKRRYYLLCHKMSSCSFPSLNSFLSHSSLFGANYITGTKPEQSYLSCYSDRHKGRFHMT